MLAYPIDLHHDGGSVLATSPDFPELTTFGDDAEEALLRAVDALQEAIAARMHDRREVPPPSSGGARYAMLPTLVSVKAMLYSEMRSKGVGKAELARRLGWHMPQVDRVLDLRHRSRLDQLEAAMGALGRRLHVTVEPAPGDPARVP